ncbi:MAG: S8 family peptidase, partial [Promethearchaeota archaeon]
MGRKHIFAITLLFLFIFVCPFPSSGQSTITSGSQMATTSNDVAPQALTVAVVGNKTFLNLGYGLQFELDESFGRTLSNETAMSNVYLDRELEVIPIPLIVSYKELSDKESIINKVNDQGGVVNLTYNRLPFLAITVPAENVSAVVDRCRSEGVKLTLFLNAKIQSCLNESVPLIKPSSNWTQVEQQAGRAINGTGTKIAILDTGIDYAHPDFYFPNGTSKITISVSLVPGEDERDYYGHGTHVAGIAAGTGIASNYTFAGVAPGAELYNIKVLDRNGMGYESWIIAGIEYATNHSASIINLSLVTNTNTDGTDPLSTAVDWAANQGVIVVAAAGNEGPSLYSVGTPACARKAITVGASSKEDYVVSFSSRGPTRDFRIKPDVVAPGLNIIAPASVGSYLWNNYPSSIVGSYYLVLSGTSMATPHVAGIAALLKEFNPSWSPERVKAAIMNSAEDLNQTSYDQGSGRVNAIMSATTSILAINSSLSFGVITTGKHVVTTNLYNMKDVPQSITEINLVTRQLGNATEYSYVTTNITAPFVIPKDESVSIELNLDLPIDAPEALYSGVLVLSFSNLSVRITYSFIYYSIIVVDVFNEGKSIEATFSAYDLSDESLSFSSGFAGSATFPVPSGTYVVHAMNSWIKEIDTGVSSPDMFLLTRVVSIEKGQLVRVNLDLNASRKISVIKTALDGTYFSSYSSDRQLMVYYRNFFSGIMEVNRGKVDYVYISDTNETIYFSTNVYVPGQVYSDLELLEGSGTSGSFYSLSWLLHGVNDTTSLILDYSRDEIIEYSLKYGYEPNGFSKSYSTIFPVFAPKSPSTFGRFAYSTTFRVFPGVVRNLNVKYVNWSLTGDSGGEMRRLNYWGNSESGDQDVLSVTFLDPPKDVNRDVVLITPPYQLFFSWDKPPYSYEHHCAFGYVEYFEPLTRIAGGETSIGVFRNNSEIPWTGGGYDNWDKAGSSLWNVYFNSYENGVYLVNATRRTGWLLWNKTEVLSEFTSPSSDTIPPT